MRRLLYCALWLLPLVCFGTEELKVLTVGNSFSASLRRYFAKAAASAGCTVKLEGANIGGCSLERHCREIAKTEADPAYRPPYYGGSAESKKYRTLADFLTADRWDIISIQQASPLSKDYSTYQPHLKNLIEYIRKHAPQAEIVIQQTWAYRTDDPRLLPDTPQSWHINQHQMYEQVAAAYNRAAADTGLRQIPTGTAVQAARDAQPHPFRAVPAETVKKLQKPNLPDQTGSLINGWRWTRTKDGKSKLGFDSIHLNARGEYLQACVWFATLFNRPATDITFVPPELTAEDAAFLRKIAQQAVEQQRAAEAGRR